MQTFHLNDVFYIDVVNDNEIYTNVLSSETDRRKITKQFDMSMMLKICKIIDDNSKTDMDKRMSIRRVLGCCGLCQLSELEKRDYTAVSA